MGPASTAEHPPRSGADGPWIGRGLLRREDQALLRGEGSFVANMRMAGMAYLAMLRSPVAHGRIGSIDVTAARAAPGVIGAMTAQDVAEAVDPMPVTSREGARLASVPIPLLARGRVRFAGEPVAAVVAETRACAADALERIDVDYEPLPVLVQPRQAVGAGVVLHDGIDDNVLLRWARTAGDVEEPISGGGISSTVPPFPTAAPSATRMTPAIMPAPCPASRNDCRTATGVHGRQPGGPRAG